MHCVLWYSVHSFHSGQSFGVLEGVFCVFVSIFPQNRSNKTTYYCAKSSTFAPFLGVAYATQGYAARRYSNSIILL